MNGEWIIRSRDQIVQICKRIERYNGSIEIRYMDGERRLHRKNGDAVIHIGPDGTTVLRTECWHNGVRVEIKRYFFPTPDHTGKVTKRGGRVMMTAKRFDGGLIKSPRS